MDLDKIVWEGSPPPKDHSMIFGGDPDSRSGIRNMNFLKSVIAGELLVIRTCNQYTNISLNYSTSSELEI